MAATTDTRQAQMTVDLGGEQVVLERARFREKLGQPFELQIDIIAGLGEIDLLPHLGKPIAVAMYEDEDLMRHFHGLISAGEFTHESQTGFHYRLVARPFTWWLAHNRDMAIFQDLSVPDIIEKVFGAAEVSDYELKLSRSYQPRTYCVQYRESDFTFVTRLMEEEGIYYYWRHAKDKHTMVLCDGPSAHEAGEPASLEYSTTTGSVHKVGSGARGGHDHFLEKLGEKVSSGGEALVTRRSFDFEKPERALQAQANERGEHPRDDREVYDYPTRYVDEGRGRALADVEMATLRRDRQVYLGRTRAISLACGTKLAVGQHPAARLNQSYLITQTEHVIQAEEYRAHDDADKDTEEEETHVQFHAIPATTGFHSASVTPRPVVQGLETAIVSGPSGEEIFTDEYGRVKVRFHWDRAGTAGEKSTCWIRVAQFGGLGNIILPRVNQEVMVDFLHGNPDDPIVMGWVFNKAQMPVYALPENKTRALWRTRSYPGGKSTTFPETMKLDTADQGANELRFEDKSGEEEVFFHAEKDMNTRIRHDSTLKVGHNEDTVIGLDRTDEVKRDETTLIGKNQKLTVKGDQTETIEAKRTIEVKANDKLTVGQSQVIEVGTTIKMTANSSITIQVGGSKITMNAGGITIDAPTVTVKGQATAKLTSPMTAVEGSGINKITGGLVLIN
ncbi:MAG: Phage-related baseplate assembly protein [Sphingomonas bacterium]|uniref:type VI secretion system Vgr family protein n=1 Tax=Sphingomonas bacterium TaxID=1895847 RepID=UPI0026189114|nr:type VI secretion system tip protein TssI/VgrG [Sphingomonas bacterium]MDB5695594.1 Phage-related baseplate assembly protein [Sphingomonas bacterium]